MWLCCFIGLVVVLVGFCIGVFRMFVGLMFVYADLVSGLCWMFTLIWRLAVWLVCCLLWISWFVWCDILLVLPVCFGLNLVFWILPGLIV